MRRATLILAGAIVFVFALSNQTNAAVPQLINYQGVLEDATGTGLDTTVNITFSIYDNAVAVTPIWTETQAVIVTDGAFRVLLGSVTTLDVTIFAGPTRFLGITVGADPEISPRVQFVSVPYSFLSVQAEYADLAAQALNADTANFADTAALAVLALIAELAIFADSTRVADSLDGFSSEDFSLAGHSHGGGASGWTDDGTVVRLDASTDSVGIGTNAPFTDLTLDGSIGFKNNTDPMMYIYESGISNPEKPIAVHSPSFPNYGLFYNDTADYFVYKGGVASALSVNVWSGKVGIGTTSPSQKLHVIGNICATGSIGACSDIRYKTNVTPLSGAAELVSRLRGVNFDWKTKEFPENAFSDKPQIGFIAQEVLEVLSQVVDQGSDGYYQVDYSRLTPLLVEAFKEQQQTIKDLQVQLVELQEQLKLLASAQKEANSANYEYGLK